jgi:ATP-dependent RNA helicase DeaD
MTPREKYLLRSIEKATRQTVEQMHMPSVADVNSSRLGKFSTQITETLSEGDLDVFRDLIDSYVAENDASPEDVAAALAKMAQGGRPLLAEEPDLPPAKAARRDRDFDRDDRGERDGRGSRGPQRGPAEGNATYRISLGRQDRVQPGNIVGALANEAGLRSSQIGHIDIRSNHSLVELPADLTGQQWDALGNTTINGRPIELQLDTGRPTRSEREGKPFRSGGGGYKGGQKGGKASFKGGFKGKKSFDRPSRDRY